MLAQVKAKGGMCAYVGLVPIGQLNKQAGSSKSSNALHTQTVSTGQHPNLFCFVSKHSPQILFHAPSVQKYGNERERELGRMFRSSTLLLKHGKQQY